MLTNTHNCYLSQLSVSLPHFRIQFNNIHFIIKLPSLTSSLTGLLLILTTLIQNQHEMNYTAVCVAYCVELCTVSGGFVLDYISNINVPYKKFRPSYCQKKLCYLCDLIS